MAFIDKIYMNGEQAREFWNWAFDHDDKCEKLTALKLSPYLQSFGNGNYYTNLPERLDWYLFNFCDLDFIQSRLREQYGNDAPKNTWQERVDKLAAMFHHDLDEINEFFDNLDEQDVCDLRHHFWLLKFNKDQQDDT